MRIVIELWVYDEVAGQFSFEWTANGPSFFNPPDDPITQPYLQGVFG